MIVSSGVIPLLLLGGTGVLVVGLLVAGTAWYFWHRALSRRWPPRVDPVADVAWEVGRLSDFVAAAVDTEPARHAELMKMLAGLGDALIAVAKAPPTVFFESWSDSGRTSAIRKANEAPPAVEDEPAPEPHEDAEETVQTPPAARARQSDAYASQRGALPADPEKPAEITGPRHAAPEAPEAPADAERQAQLVQAVAR